MMTLIIVALIGFAFTVALFGALDMFMQLFCKKPVKSKPTYKKIKR